MGMWSRVHGKEARGAMVVLACAGALLVLPVLARAETCPNAAFRSGPSEGLPDCRVYEMVSPAEKEDGDVYVPQSGPKGHAIISSFPFRAAADGDGVAYVGDPSSEGNGSIGEGNGNSYLATRGPEGGWSAQDIQPKGLHAPIYQAFSSDLSVGILSSPEILPGTDVPKELEGYSLLYSRTDSDGAYDPLFTVKPPTRLPKEFGSASGEATPSAPLYGGANAGTSTVPAFSHILLEANDALTGNAVYGGGETNNLYESVDGRLNLVNVLPGGAGEPNDNATFGAPREESLLFNEPPDFSHDISADGSRVFWSSLNSKWEVEDLYVREDQTETKLISEGGRFWTANSEGTEAFFTKDGGLFEWREAGGVGETIDLVPGVEVLGVLGASEDGEYVYYVNAGYELELWHDGASTFIAPLSPKDDDTGIIYSNDAHSGDWRAGLGARSAEVTPNGGAIVFMSSQELTGYPNEGLQEVYVYEAESGRLFCVSCDPSGVPPPNTKESDAAILPLSFGGYPVTDMNTYQPRWIDEEGSRVFFDSEEPLVSQDRNGVQDVYEWERDGTGSCRVAEGCIYLISSGTSPDISALVDASADGDDVFFVTRSQLVPEDRTEEDDLYDARVGGVQPLAESACTESGCQGVPSAPPLFATPPSVTFSGVGNFEAPAPAAAVKPKAKPLTRAQKLAGALRACGRDRRGARRARCQARARKRYGRPVKRAGKSSKGGGRA